MRLRTAWEAFWEGFGSVLDLGGTRGLPRAREILDRSDEEALEEDVQELLRDFRKALSKSSRK